MCIWGSSVEALQGKPAVPCWEVGQGKLDTGGLSSYLWLGPALKTSLPNFPKAYFSSYPVACVWHLCPWWLFFWIHSGFLIKRKSILVSFVRVLSFRNMMWILFPNFLTSVQGFLTLAKSKNSRFGKAGKILSSITKNKCASEKAFFFSPPSSIWNLEYCNSFWGVVVYLFWLGPWLVEVPGPGFEPEPLQAKHQVLPCWAT